MKLCSEFGNKAALHSIILVSMIRGLAESSPVPLDLYSDLDKLEEKPWRKPGADLTGMTMNTTLATLVP